jgi:hypothetical protein
MFAAIIKNVATHHVLPEGSVLPNALKEPSSCL